MFLGQYQYILDSKARLTIPAKFRELSAPTLVVTRHPSESCLIAMPVAAWNLFTEKLNNLPMVDTDSALLRRMLYSAAEDLRLDGQGRVLLTQRLRDYAHIDTEVIVVGMGTHMEIWDPGNWYEIERHFQETDLNRKAFAALGI
jgi:MraZ protein